MSEVGAEIIKTEETKENGIKYLNINVSNSEVERNPDIVRLCANVGIKEYVKPKTGHWIHHKEKMFDCVEHWECSHCHRTIMTNPFSADSNDYNVMYYCPKCGAKMNELEGKLDEQT